MTCADVANGVLNGVLGGIVGVGLAIVAVGVWAVLSTRVRRVR